MELDKDQVSSICVLYIRIQFILNFSLKKNGLGRGPYLFSTRDDNVKSESSPSKHPWSHVFQ